MNSIKRQSGIELLRILCMLFILLGHTFFLQNSNLPDIHDNIFPFSLCSVIESIGLGSVNTFVLISGWFGIHFKVKGLFKLVFEFFFLIWGIWLFAFICHKVSFNHETINGLLGTVEGYWFVFAYVGLYIFSPVLNAFAEHSTKKELASLLIIFYVFQCYYTWATDMVNYFSGYGITLFCGLYLTARYFRRYPVEYIVKNSLYIYLAATLTIATVSIIGYYYVGNALRMIRYDNPLVIIASLSILITFSKFTFYNRIINWLAASAFAAYIIHFHPFVFPYYRQGLSYCLTYLGNHYTILVYIIYIISVYIVCTIIDQTRIIVWNVINKINEKC